MNAISGTLTHSTGSTSLDVGVTTIVDADGPAADGSLSALNANLYLYSYNTGTNHTYFSGTYDYVTAFDGNYTALGVRNITGGVYGVTTAAADIPSAGTATYAGEAGGEYNHTLATGSTSYSFLTNGSSAVTADFDANRVNVVMKNFTALDSSGTVLAQDVFDEVRLTNMSIIGNGFSGGGIEFYKGGTAVTLDTVIGTSISSLSGANFFGYDTSIGAPDEVGGVYTQTGLVGTLNLVFVAD